jgi:hypothetical protein
MIENKPEYSVLTTEELILVNKSDAELSEQVGTVSFDLKIMASRLNSAFKSGEKWAIIIHTHLYLDHILTLTLVEAMVRPKSLQVDRLSFVQKVAFLDALGLLSEALKPPVLAVNKLRNKVAHHIDVDITSDDELHLFSTVSKEVKSEVSINEGINPFNQLMRGLIALAEGARQNHAFHRIKRRQHSIGAKVVSEKIRIALGDPE